MAQTQTTLSPSVISVADQVRQIADEIETVIVGKRTVVEMALTAFLSNGHVLLEDVPGTGKTTLAKSLARAHGCVFKRVQFTPDLLPADITGTAIFNQRNGEFEFREGPVFGNIILADEINRATPKTQSSLLECMEEHQVTNDGITYELPRPFFVIATENNIDSHGTHPLPEAQLDRFLMRLSMGYPQRDEEAQILERQTKTSPLTTIARVYRRHRRADAEPSAGAARSQPARLPVPASRRTIVRSPAWPRVCAAGRHQAPCPCGPGASHYSEAGSSD